MQSSIYLCMTLLLFGPWLGATERQSSVADTPVWRVGVVADYYPLSYLDAEGTPTGLGTELIKVIAANAGIELVYQVDIWSRLRHELQNGNLDIAPFVTYSSDRAAEFGLSVPYISGQLTLLRHRSAPVLDAISGLNGQRVAVMDRTISHDFLLTAAPQAQLVFAKDVRGMAALLAEGLADYALQSAFTGDRQVSIANQRDIILNPLADQEMKRWVSIGIGNSSPDTLQLVNQGLAVLYDSGDFQRLKAQWSAELEPASITLNAALNVLLWVVGGGATIMLVVVLWSWSLRKQVLLKTRHLREEIVQRERLEQQLQHGLKMEALGQLSGGIAHDFNNILSSVLSYTDLAQERLQQQRLDKLPAYLQQIKTASHRATQLISQLLLFSRTPSPDIRRLQPALMVEEVQLLLRASLPKTLTLDSVNSAPGAFIEMNPIQFHQILMNLCVNARDAIQGRGRIGIEICKSNYLNPSCAACGQAVTGAWIEIRVQDSGSGIAPEDRPQIFSLGFSTKAVGQGSGTGLATVSRLVHEHHGHILLSSSPQGTAFSLLFPEAESDGHERGALSEFPHGGQILIIDEQATFSSFVGELLANRGFQAVVISDIAALQQRSGSISQPYDLVILGGCAQTPATQQAVTQLLSILGAVPILLCSQTLSDLPSCRWRSVGISEVLIKPVKPYRLLSAINQILDADGVPPHR